MSAACGNSATNLSIDVEASCALYNFKRQRVSRSNGVASVWFSRKLVKPDGEEQLAERGQLLAIQWLLHGFRRLNSGHALRLKHIHAQPRA